MPPVFRRAKADQDAIVIRKNVAADGTMSGQPGEGHGAEEDLDDDKIISTKLHACAALLEVTHRSPHSLSG